MPRCCSWMLSQERHQIFDATGGVAVADVVGRRVVVKQFGARDSLVHLLVGARVSDFFPARRNDERGSLDRRNLVHEVVRAHVQDKAGDEGWIIRTRLFDEPFDQVRISRRIKPLVDGIGEELLQTDLLDPRYPSRRMAILETRRRPKESE